MRWRWCPHATPENGIQLVRTSMRVDGIVQEGYLACMPPQMGYQAAPLVTPPGNFLDWDMLACELAYTDARCWNVGSSPLALVIVEPLSVPSNG